MKNRALTDRERENLTGGDKLLGDRLKAAFAAFGFPPCSGCDKRAEWLNKVHAWLRGGCAERQERLNELGDAITGEHRRPEGEAGR